MSASDSNADGIGGGISGGSAFDVIIAGAGASGLICALEAARRGLRVLLLESGEEPGRKIVVAGGGRANFSNRDVTPRHYRSSLPKSCAPALRAFTPDDAIRLMESWGLPWEERGHGQLFLTTAAAELRDALVRACREAGCRIVRHAPVSRAWLEDGMFLVRAGDGLWTARGLGLAMGGPARPRMGATGMGFELARSFGHAVVPPVPALTPLIMPETWPHPEANCADLAGICLPARLSLPGRPEWAWEDDLLFTHDGISGPATLKASLFWEPGQELHVDFSPHARLEDVLNAPGRILARTGARRLLPQRLADALLPPELADRKCAGLSRADRAILVAAVHDNRVTPLRAAGLDRAEACAGGVSMEDIRPNSMESALVPRLWLMGEVLDVTGLLGGYNLHWAWASGMAAARGMARSLGGRGGRKAS